METQVLDRERTFGNWQETSQITLKVIMHPNKKNGTLLHVWLMLEIWRVSSILLNMGHTVLASSYRDFNPPIRILIDIAAWLKNHIWTGRLPVRIGVSAETASGLDDIGRDGWVDPFSGSGLWKNHTTPWQPFLLFYLYHCLPKSSTFVKK